ncbi:TKL protein kinase [Salpingoeca rosetta]|uniref:TKL protein kinase n=1 Tax=Salpingoeca rosetta (strain ATCC 50818 / BSB-021) TaxID=946362 RepID=F2UI46_SALR5|nr:TKL protein kinase [Salpingoeca rosetta]EGD76795.1 TKL protein kinase [Salpingoeca rosetta]|eukprot:XP_004991167.1 TKL protein kinase [Salpingoeca rosetta]
MKVAPLCLLSVCLLLLSLWCAAGSSAVLPAAQVQVLDHLCLQARTSLAQLHDIRKQASAEVRGSGTYFSRGKPNASSTTAAALLTTLDLLPLQQAVAHLCAEQQHLYRRTQHQQHQQPYNKPNTSPSNRPGNANNDSDNDVHFDTRRSHQHITGSTNHANDNTPTNAPVIAVVDNAPTKNAATTVNHETTESTKRYLSSHHDRFSSRLRSQGRPTPAPLLPQERRARIRRDAHALSNNNDSNNNNNSNNSDNNRPGPGSSSGPSRNVDPRPHHDNRTIDTNCALADLLDGVCVLSATETTFLEITIDVNLDLRDALQTQTLDTSSLDRSLPLLERLSIRGWQRVPEPVPSWALSQLFAAKAWQSVRVLELNWLETRGGFDFTWLNSMPNLSEVRGRDLRLNTLKRTHFRPVPNVTEPYSFAGALTDIVLSRCGIDSVAPTLFHSLTALRKINLVGNGIAHLSAVQFVGLEALSAVSLQENAILAIEPQTFANLSRLQTLDLTDNRIHRVDHSVFVGLASCWRLNLGGNRISVIPEDVFKGLSNLEVLLLDRNRITAVHHAAFNTLQELFSIDLRSNGLTSLDTRVFEGLSRLQVLVLASNAFRQLSPGVLTPLARLGWLDVSSNSFTQLPQALTHDRLPSLHTLNLGFNQITTLPPNAMDALTTLNTVRLNHNRLVNVGSDALAGLSALEQLFLDHNDITHIASGTLTHTPRLRLLWVNNNERIHEASIPDLSGENVQLPLVELALDSSQLKTFPFRLPHLENLGLYNVSLTRMPEVSSMPNLTALFLTNHALPVVELEAFRNNARLQLLDLSTDSFMHSTVRVPEAPVHLPSLEVLSLDNMVAPPNILRKLVPSSQGLVSLRLTGPDFTDHTFNITHMCSVLSSEVENLALLNTSLSTVELCPPAFSVDFDNVLLARSPTLRAVTLEFDADILDVSRCPQLDMLKAPLVHTLDVTNSTVGEWSRELCTTIGTSRLFMNNVRIRSGIESFYDIVSKCMGRANLIDISNNQIIDPKTLSNAVSTFRIGVDSGEATFGRNPAEGKQTQVVTTLLTDNMPVTCSLKTVLGKQLSATTWVGQDTALFFTYDCACARDHRKASEGHCVRRGKSLSPGAIAGIVLAVVLTNVAVIGYYECHVKRIRRLKKDRDLNQRLLEEREEEVFELKRAWDIPEDELDFLTCISADTAAGDVWKARWDTLVVAVKVLKSDQIQLAESLQEFQKEVDFLQRTRHPNLVRFFGAGRRSLDGSPFLVLEYVALGSLHDLICSEGHDSFVDAVNGALRRSGEARQSVASERNRAGSAWLDVELTSAAEDKDNDVHVSLTSAREGMDAWDLKVAFMQDVACGMAFIHSLGHLHRDLKSGNVLVSSSLRAKITDFGTIRLSLNGRDDEETAMATSLMHQQLLLSSQLSMTMTAGVGTPLYMAPEVLLGTKYDTKADVFSFGVLMWEIATQRRPDLIEQECGTYRGPLLAKLFELLNSGKRLAFPDELGCPAWYRNLAAACMAQEPQTRPVFAQIEVSLKASTA